MNCYQQLLKYAKLKYMYTQIHLPKHTVVVNYSLMRENSEYIYVPFVINMCESLIEYKIWIKSVSDCINDSGLKKCEVI